MAILRWTNLLLIVTLAWAAPVAAQIVNGVYVSDPVASSASHLIDSTDGKESGSCDESQACCGWRAWYVQADALFLHRNIGRDIKIVESRPESPLSLSRGEQATVLDTHDFDFDYQWGPRITLGTCHGCRTIEVTYFGLHHWRDDLSVSSTNQDLDVPFQSNLTSDFDDADTIAASYSSELHNLEVNWLEEYDWIVTPLAGFRYLYLKEEFDLQATDIDPTAQTSNYLIDAENHLLGVQVGGILHGQGTGRLGWNVAGKAGVYANFAQQHTLLRDNNNTVLLRDFNPEGEELAFLGELSLNFTYELTDLVELRAGYQVFWLEGVALAPEQLDFTTTATSGSLLNTDGGLFFDGGYIGLTLYR